MNTTLVFFLSIGIPLIIGGISGGITATPINGWYKTARKPSFNPPNYVFGPVWTLLYIQMGVSLFIILQTEGNHFWAIASFALQLLLNFFWSILFFNLRKLSWALIEMFVLLTSICLMIYLFYQISPMAAFLQIPYLCWVCFATVLTAAFWKLNQ